MKSIIISSNGSSGGKTTVTMGLLKVLKNRGFKVQSYKVGPDYIDPDFHEYITKVPARNLDLYLMGEEGVKASFSRGKGDYGIVEGVMGLYDGKGISTEYSTAHVAKVLNLPVILVLSPKAKASTLCAEILGLMNFESVNIAGIIFNNIKESYYKLLKAAVEKYCDIKVFGYVPKDERLSLKSRHLGLVQSTEIEDLNKKIDICAELMENNLDIESLLQCFANNKEYIDNFHVKNIGIKSAVALDKAFSFYYRENIELLQELGEVRFFSPLEDKELPKDIDFIYLGGGYPEVFIEKLTGNKTMLKSIRDALNSGIRCYAECGGLMYLTEAIDERETVGFFKGTSSMTNRLQNFGYANIEVVKENSMMPKGLSINCHEFHKSQVRLDENSIYDVTKISYDGSIKRWNCGYVKQNTLGSYAHVHFFGDLEMLKALIGSKRF
ncbi:cobyrinate a,c-diamide synthase [Clostridium arbusti]|uniref:cobyrinate a,c-diamide synthase n=1 Tax=Clostridium arbusti TaxID=1137848 RepID=UPI000289B13F|nr:cobyrinate a,c-diamide synthase [Clostridium arbusti]